LLAAPLSVLAEGATGSEHPDPEIVAAHAAGELPAEEALAVTRHIAVCADGRCPAVLRDVLAGASVAREALYGRREERSDVGIVVPDHMPEHTFACSDDLWEAFANLARAEGASIDGLLNDAMRAYVQQRSGPVPPSRVMVRDATSPADFPRERNTPTVQRAFLPRAPAAARRISPYPFEHVVPLTVVVGGVRYPVTKDRFVVGRGGGASDLAIDDPVVSRQHAMIEHAGGAYYLVDMGSTNGVEYEGQRIARKQIAHGDRVRIGDHELEFLFG
jgi:hypothetical protein